MLSDPARHEPLRGDAWDAARAQAAIERIVRDAEAGASPSRWWPVHPKDLEPGDDPAMVSTSLYCGAAGVVWALRHLRAVGAIDGGSLEAFDLDRLRDDHRAWLASQGSAGFGSYLMGDLPIEMMAWDEDRAPQRLDRIAALIEDQLDHPALELMWGSPGALLAATLLHERSGDARFADLARRIAARLAEQLRGSDEHGRGYWEQSLYGRRSSCLGGVHGFVATAHGLIRARALLGDAAWRFWREHIVRTVERTATHDGGFVNWRPELIEPAGRPRKWLMQFCHGGPGFVVCLGSLPGDDLDALLLAAGETIWAAGPLAKGAGLCHGTAGNGCAFLKLHVRTGDSRWLERARAFAMHAIAQSEADARRYGGCRHSLWTGNEGLAMYLRECIRGGAEFPTLDRFFP